MFFLGFGAQANFHDTYLGQLKKVLLGYTFAMMYRVPQTEIICKSYAPENLTYQLPPSRPTNLLAFHLPGLGFWILIKLKRPLESHCDNHLLANSSSLHISSQR
jgi:hypothetical protein